MAMVSMESNETKKCKIVPKKYNYIPDLLIQNKRIEKETTMNLNPKEIKRAMAYADVFAIGELDEETLLTPLNFCYKDDTVSEDAGDEEEPEEEETLEEESPKAEGSSPTEDGGSSSPTSLTSPTSPTPTGSEEAEES